MKAELLIGCDRDNMKSFNYMPIIYYSKCLSFKIYANTIYKGTSSMNLLDTKIFWSGSLQFNKWILLNIKTFVHP